MDTASRRRLAIRLVVRRWSGDDQSHLYPADELDNFAVPHLIPVCAADWRYPVRHDREELSTPVQGALFDGCRRCHEWARVNRHRIVLSGAMSTGA
ncbi:hypothetical protein [Amycolatopsis nigrescens]|uniref:hypothetical protein n=1 Tax=Amycolatopsis nigrescens TaxID=381445 RepID=UPI000364821F|nr:hypothetical protein [Amycolatopsis nigrescens]